MRRRPSPPAPGRRTRGSRGSSRGSPCASQQLRDQRQRDPFEPPAGRRHQRHGDGCLRRGRRSATSTGTRRKEASAGPPPPRPAGGGWDAQLGGQRAPRGARGEAARDPGSDPRAEGRRNRRRRPLGNRVMSRRRSWRSRPFIDRPRQHVALTGSGRGTARSYRQCGSGAALTS